MIKTLFHQIGAYKKDSILTPIYAAAEVIMEILIPFVTAAIIDEGIQAGNMQKVLQYGVIMIVLALLSLYSGGQEGSQCIYRICLQSAGEYVSEHTDLFLFQY